MQRQTFPLWLCYRHDGPARELWTLGRREHCERAARFLRSRGFRAQTVPSRILVVEWVATDATPAIGKAA